MKRVPLTNPHTDRTLHVGGVVIPPGDTRLVDEHAVPKALQAPKTPAVQEPEPNPMAELAEQKVDDIVAALPELDDEQLAELLDLEQAADKPRKGVLEPITELQLERAKGDED